MTTPVEEFLAHYGVLGMKWGVRKDRGSSRRRRSEPEELSRRDRKRAIRKIRTLESDEIQMRIERLRLEKQLRDLTQTDLSPGKKFVGDIMKNSGRTVLTTVVTGAMLYGIKAALTGKWSAKEAADYIVKKKK